MFRQSSWVTCREDLSLQPDLMGALEEERQASGRQALFRDKA